MYFCIFHSIIYVGVLYYNFFFNTGRYLTMLPMEPKLGKMLILGAILNCLDPILTVAAGLSVRDPFLSPLEKKDVSQSNTEKKFVILDIILYM